MRPPKVLDVSRAITCHWWAAYQQDCLDAAPGDPTGWPQGPGFALSNEQAARTQMLIDANTPGRLGILAALWIRRADRDLIRQETGVAPSVRTVGRYLRPWAYTAKRPTRRTKGQDPEEVRVWLEETYPTLQRAAKEQAEIFWCGEVGVAADDSHRRGYARRANRRSWRCWTRTSG